MIWGTVREFGWKEPLKRFGRGLNKSTLRSSPSALGGDVFSAGDRGHRVFDALLLQFG